MGEFENSELNEMVEALDRETTLDKHQQLDKVLEEVQSQLRTLQDLHSELNSKE